MDLVITHIAGSVRQAPVPPQGGARPLETNASPISPASPAAAAPVTDPSVEPASAPAALAPGFTVVVLELRNEQGQIITTVPNAQQLAAYRNGTATPPT